jgi:hypothetical protein
VKTKTYFGTFDTCAPWGDSTEEEASREWETDSEKRALNDQLYPDDFENAMQRRYAFWTDAFARFGITQYNISSEEFTTSDLDACRRLNEYVESYKGYWDNQTVYWLYVRDEVDELLLLYQNRHEIGTSFSHEHTTKLENRYDREIAALKMLQISEWNAIFTETPAPISTGSWIEYYKEHTGIWDEYNAARKAAWDACEAKSPGVFDEEAAGECRQAYELAEARRNRRLNG